MGVVERVSGNSVTVVFRSLSYRGTKVGITSTTTDFVNSKGHKLVDDAERPLRLAAGAFVGDGAQWVLDEGAEVRLVVNSGGAGSSYSASASAGLAEPGDGRILGNAVIAG